MSRKVAKIGPALGLAAVTLSLTIGTACAQGTDQGSGQGANQQQGTGQGAGQQQGSGQGTGQGADQQQGAGQDAGQGSGQQQGAGQGAPTTDVDASDEELDQFAAAVGELQSIQQSYSEEMGQADDRDKAQDIQKEMQDEMREAIKDEGLSVERYSEIGQAAQNDPELREKINKRTQEQ